MNNKNKEPLVTIMRPVFNGLKLIRASIASLLAQTYSNWECIIVDDGSTDGTSEYLDSLQDIRFRVVHFKENQGRPFARQKALELANGKYLAMLDADDLYRRNKIELQVKIMENNPNIILVSSAICSFGTNTDLRRRRGAEVVKIVNYHGEKPPVHASSMLITQRAKLFKYNSSLKSGEDADFLERYLKDGTYYLDPNILYYYSEFDSVTKQKILKSYRIRLSDNIKKTNILEVIELSIKYLVQSIRFRFLSIEQILSQRGKKLSEQENIDYLQECRPLLSRNL